MKKLIKFISDYMLAICLVLTLLGKVALFSMPIYRMNMIPHIITYASCNLALIGFIFSLLLGLKGGFIYSRLVQKYRETTKKIYWRIFYISGASSASVLLSILILSVKVWTQWMKYLFAGILLFVFIYMFLGTLSILGVLIQLMIDEFPRMKDEGHI